MALIPVTPPSTTTVVTVAPTLQPEVHTEQITGFVTFHLFGQAITINPMVCILGLIIIYGTYSIHQAQKQAQFDFWDLVMDDVPAPTANGLRRRASLIKICFAIAFGFSTWIIVDQDIKGTLTAEMFGLYLTVWCGALIAKVVWEKPFDADTILAMWGQRSRRHREEEEDPPQTQRSEAP